MSVKKDHPLKIPQSKEKRKVPNSEKVISRYPEVVFFRIQAKKRNKSVTLTDEQIHSLMSRNCRYCGEEPSMRIPHTLRYRNTIDRIDSAIGYTPENSTTACRTCNLMKHTLSREHFLRKVERIHEYVQDHYQPIP